MRAADDSLCRREAEDADVDPGRMRKKSAKNKTRQGRGRKKRRGMRNKRQKKREMKIADETKKMEICGGRVDAAVGGEVGKRRKMKKNKLLIEERRNTRLALVYGHANSREILTC